MRRLGLLLLLFWIGQLSAQFSKTHYLPALSADEQIVAEEQFLYISTPSIEPVNFRIIYLGGSITEGTVSRDTPYVQSMGVGNSTQIVVNGIFAGQVLSNKGIIIEADDLIYAALRLTAGDGNQAGELVSKGMAALGTDFRVGGMVNTLMSNYSQIHYTFASILATENNTTVNFSDINPGADLRNEPTVNGTDFSITLNSGESYVIAVSGPEEINRDALIGSRIQSDKPIVVNCGSFGGTNGPMSNMDLGFDQIVSAERTGTDYIFIKSTGHDEVEKILLIANEDATDIFLSGNTVPDYTLNAGEYLTLDGTQYSANGNLYVHSSKNIFAYQSIGDDSRTDEANQELFFVPPLSCETPHVIDNVPLIQWIGDRLFDISKITLITETGATLTFRVDEQTYSLADLAGLGVTVSGPTSVPGNASYETYIVNSLAGNVAVNSTGQLYLAAYGTSEAATFGGFFSGFTFKPEIRLTSPDTASEDCLPNVQLSVSELSAFDNFQWFYNEVAIPGATGATYNPTLPGYYHVKAAITTCNTELESDRMPVSLCPPDSDGDGVNDNIDLDLDNDGLDNCAESYGDKGFNLTGLNGGTIAVGNYANPYTIVYPGGNGPQPVSPFTGYSTGDFSIRATAGEGHSSIAEFSFTDALPLEITTNTNLVPADQWFGPNSEVRISVPPSQTLTVLNPDNQLLIDTNSDGTFENGVSRYSSFELRIRLNPTANATPVTATYQIRGIVDHLKIEEINLEESAASSASFNLRSTCVYRDSDGDGVADALDFDSDDDGIPDLTEIQGNNPLAYSGVDANLNGFDDGFESLPAAVDYDGDGVPDLLDLDSDNNGIYDIVELGTAGSDTDNDGKVNGNHGSNGWLDALESSADSGMAATAVLDTNNDQVPDFRDPDNDADGCNDVIEAGFTDNDGNGYLGSGIPSVNALGVVTGLNGYTTPNPDYLIAAPIQITHQPTDATNVCEDSDGTFTIGVNAGTTIQWQQSADNLTFTPIADGVSFSGTTTATLTLLQAPIGLDGYWFRAVLSRPGNGCGAVSQAVQISIVPKPPVLGGTLVQCEPDLNADGLVAFNLQQATAQFTTAGNFSVRYFTDMAAATGGTALPDTYTNTQNPQTLVVEITDVASGCRSYGTLELNVNIVPVIALALPDVCEDALAEDGFAMFDLTSAGFGGDLSTLTYYESLNDALLEQNAIVQPAAYQNSLPYTVQTLYVRRENDNECTELFTVAIHLLPLPAVDLTTGDYIVCRNEPDVTVDLEVTFTDGTSPNGYSYAWELAGQPLPDTSSSLTVSQAGTYTVTVTGANGCSKVRTFVVAESGQAIIQEVVIRDLSLHNAIDIILTPDSPGNYEYQLTPGDPWQPAGSFTDVAPGIYELHIRDLNGCSETIRTLNVLGVSPFFTPNGDGYNDRWTLKGVSATYNPGATLYIFDRFGKLLYQLSGVGEGWDGTYLGNPLPADDYWYRIEVLDGRSAVGHFALKR